MIRLLAGRYRGRSLAVPQSGTRPTSARVRQAVFDILERGGHFALDLSGARVADLYAGSGAMGFEALSRGALEVVFVDSSRRAASALRKNARRLGAEHLVSVFVGRLPEAVGRLSGPFHLVFLDPPYARWRLGLDTLVRLQERGRLAQAAVCVLELPGSVLSGLDPGPFDIRLTRVWGDTGVVFLEPRDRERESEEA